ncbi:MAG: phosphoribosylamine--glycine ligase PurD [Pseudomonadota bacterium]|jgi:phosphoribosylamine--glycine ligase
MNFLVIGQGGREHAIVRALRNSPSVKEIHAIPGNPGMASEILCHSLDWKNFSSISDFCRQFSINVVVIGPEDPLVMGLSDFLRDQGILVVGPSKAAAQLEGSKVFAKEFMQEFGVATARATTVRSVEETLRAANAFTPPYVLKADGLAAGKGVVLCKDIEQLRSVANQFFEQKLFGSASEKALLEQFLPGDELSLLLLTNGSEYQLLPLAQDHKQLNDGDQGPNTGGMGTIAPMGISPELSEQIKTRIIEPSLKGLQSRGMFYRGVIFLGLMVTNDGPQLLEYNCRMGDPETQVVLPLLKGDWGQVFFQLAQGHLSELTWKQIFSACIVLAAPGYPDSPEKGVIITGELAHQSHSSYFLHAGTRRTDDGQWVTAGGRVMCAIGIGSTKDEARTNAYEQANHVAWKGLQKRSDIGLRTPKKI